MIKLLDTATVNKIAAGEVIERPFSIVKELVENAIDAGSAKVVIEIRDGGVSFIRVTDNGAGIPADEIEIAFTSHATSKLNAISDLNYLNTLGFRGEALASIAAVSQLEITTKTAAQDSGVCLEIFGGEILSKKETACNTGTSVVTRNIFYNTPARKKFLKSPAAETGYISDFVNKIALARPEISFRFINNGTEVLFTSGNADLKTAIFCVYGLDYTEKSIKTDYSHEGIDVSGFIGKPELSRSNRLSEDMFVNGRFVKDKIISKATEDAYKTYLMTGKFPAFVLHIGINPKDVDVNAHPQKLEVRFSNEQDVYDAVYNAVSEALKSTSLIPRAEWVKGEDLPQTLKNSEKPIIYPDVELKQFYTAKENEVYVLDNPVILESQNTDFEKSIFEAMKAGKAEQINIEREELFSNYTIIGQVFQTYWIIEESGRLYIIDQHAAHERILFENIKTRLLRSDIVSQTILVPEKLTVTEREKGIITGNIDFFNTLGFDIELIESELFLKSLPIILFSPENTQTIKQLVDMLSDGFANDAKSSIYDIRINTLAVVACKAAVKGNDRLRGSEAREIIEKLLSLDNPFTCPHGRPTIVEITKYELESMFKRV